MIPVWFNSGQGTWDQGLVAAAIAGTLWPLPVEFEVVPEPREHGLMVVHGEVALSQPPLRPPPGTLLLHTSDEHQRFDSARFRSSTCRTWAQHVSPLRPMACDRRFVPGWPPGTREGLRDLPRTVRRLWGFAGQTQNASRRAFVEVVRERKDGDLRLSGGFAQGMERPDYLRFLAETAIVPCPAGNANPESFRMYEALEAGSLPIPQRSFPGFPPGFDWWTWTLGEQPALPVVDNWAELPALLDHYREDPQAIGHDQARALAWWIGYKRRFALDLVNDLQAIGCEMSAHPVTVLISSSPVPSHPSTDMIENTIRKVREYPALAKADVLIMLDGVSPADEPRRPAYEEYIRRLVALCNSHPDFAGCLPIVFDRHVHQAGMTRLVLPRVQTPYIFFVEHDTWPSGKIDFGGLIRAMQESDFANAIRLHVFHTILPEHRYLYAEDSIHEVQGQPLMRTTDWSQRPHLARTDWYRQMFERHIPDRPMWIEHALHGPICAAPWEDFRVCIYAPPGDMTRSSHADGRRLGASDAA